MSRTQYDATFTEQLAAFIKALFTPARNGRRSAR
jgi:hypothetical protein